MLSFIDLKQLPPKPQPVAAADVKQAPAPAPAPAPAADTKAPTKPAETKTDARSGGGGGGGFDIGGATVSATVTAVPAPMPKPVHTNSNSATAATNAALAAAAAVPPAHQLHSANDKIVTNSSSTATANTNANTNANANASASASASHARTDSTASSTSASATAGTKPSAVPSSLPAIKPAVVPAPLPGPGAPGTQVPAQTGVTVKATAIGKPIDIGGAMDAKTPEVTVAMPKSVVKKPKPKPKKPANPAKLVVLGTGKPAAQVTTKAPATAAAAAGTVAAKPGTTLPAASAAAKPAAGATGTAAAKPAAAATAATAATAKPAASATAKPAAAATSAAAKKPADSKAANANAKQPAALAKSGSVAKITTAKGTTASPAKAGDKKTATATAKTGTKTSTPVKAGAATAAKKPAAGAGAGSAVKGKGFEETAPKQLQRGDSTMYTSETEPEPEPVPEPIAETDDAVAAAVAADGTIDLNSLSEEAGVMELDLESVCSLVTSLGAAPAVVQAFRGNSVDGKLLATLTDDDLKGDLKIADETLRAKILARVTELKEQKPDVALAASGAGHVKVVPKGDLTIGEKMGGGAFSDVFLVTWQNEQCALKLFRDGHKHRSAFIHEAKTLARLHHPHIIRMLAVVHSSTELGIMMGQAPNTVTDVLMANNMFADLKSLGDQRIVAQMAVDTAGAVAFIHSDGLLHCDLATRQLLLDDEFRVVLTDFGMARRIDPNTGAGTHRAGPDSAVPVPGAMGSPWQIGPIRWQSPELLKDGKYTTASDVWALGCLLWELYSRTVPYPELDIVQVATKVAGSGCTLPLDPAWPQAVRDIMTACWKLNPSERPTAAVVHQRLSDFLASLVPDLPPADEAAPAAKKAAKSAASASDASDSAALATASASASAAGSVSVAGSASASANPLASREYGSAVAAEGVLTSGSGSSASGVPSGASGVTYAVVNAASAGSNVSGGTNASGAPITASAAPLSVTYAAV